MAAASVIAFFSTAVFLGNVAFSATGFAMAIVFLFLYQLGSLAWLDCCNIRYAVFIQTIGFVVILPITLWRSNLRDNIRAELLVAFVPITFAGTPLGQYLQDFTPVGALKVLIGSLTILVAAWQIHEYCKKRRKEKRLEKNNESKVVEDNVLTALLQEERPPVFFLIGSQRSGSNWLHTMISESKVIATPHPPHILKSFVPILDKFGDLFQEDNMRALVDHVCDFVEKNPVPWVDINEERIIFDREQVFQCCKGSNVPVVAVFEAIMDVFTVRNECETWMCKSMSYGTFHEQLSMHFGSRLRYVYLHRDPRDVCLSFSKAPVGEAHYYVIAETWRDLQEIAIDLLNSVPEGTMHQLSYEALLSNKQETLDSLFQFLDIRNKEQVYGHIISREAYRRASHSSLWRNLVRGKSLSEIQKDKWKRSEGLTDDDVKIIEAQCSHVMNVLGYELEYTDQLPKFSEEEIAEFRRLNEEGKAAKKASLQETDPEDHKRRMLQASVLEKNVVFPEKSEAESFWHEVKNQLWPLRPVSFWMLLAGFTSGFLGGLIGVRGPPLIIFFFFFEYPKSQIKANGTIVATINVVIRVVTYIVRSPPASYPSKNWFTEEDKYLYIFVSIIGVLGAPVGLWLSKHINQTRFKMILACILIINGVTMIVTGSFDL